MTRPDDSSSPSPRPHTRLAERLYALRWLLTAISVAGVFAAGLSGWSRVETFSAQVDRLRDPAVAALGPGEPRLFDVRYDLWFDPRDRSLAAYREIEARFVREDFVLVAIEEREHPRGVFRPECLSTIYRLSQAIERVPYVRRVRSLTSNPWIRWGEIEPGESGLLVGDLFVRPPAEHSDDEILERMISILGATRAARLVGAERVREIVGETPFEDLIGEPRLLGDIVSDDGRTTAILVQILRPSVTDEELTATFGDDPKARQVGPAMFANDAQWAALDGIRHALQEEAGLAIETDEARALRASLTAAEPGEARTLALRQLEHPSLRFAMAPDGSLVRKHRYFAPGEDGAWLDVTDPGAPVVAEGFTPEARSEHEFHVAGMPNFLRNFQDVGLRDLRFVGGMFLVLILVLFLIFRRVTGVVTPLFVLGASVFGMLGVVWLAGDSLNNLTAATPNMVTAIGIADAIHLLASYFALRSSYSDRRALVVEVVRRNAVPVFLTSVTTAVGYFSLLTSDIVPMRMLAYTAGLGTLLAWALSMTVVPTILSLLPLPRRSKTAPTETSGAGPLAPERRDSGLRDSGRRNSGRRNSDVSAHFVDWVMKRRVGISLIGFLVVAFSIWGVSRIEIDSDFRTMFPEDNPVMTDFTWIETRLGGAGDLELVFSAPPVDETDEARSQRRRRIDSLETRAAAAAESLAGFAELSADESGELARLKTREADLERRRIAVSSDFLTEVERFERRLAEERSDPGSPLRVVTKISGPLDVLRKMHQVQNENRATFYRVPDDSDVPAAARTARFEYDPILEEALRVPPQTASTLAAQYYLQYENGARPTENLSTLISADRTVFRVEGRVRQAPTRLQEEAFARIRELARTEFPRIAGTKEEVERGDALSELTISGKTVLYAGMTSHFSESLAKSLALALLIITILIGLIYRSVTYALVSIVPNVLPIFVPLAFFGLLGWSLDGPSIIVASVALGVCVDDTIHFFTKFARGRRAGLSVRDSLRAVFHDIGGALTFTTVVLMLGFGALSFSEFAPNRLLGQLAVAMIALAWLADFLLTPALLTLLFDRRKPTPAADRTPSSSPAETATGHPTA